MRDQIPRRPDFGSVLHYRRRCPTAPPENNVPLLLDHGRTGGDEPAHARLAPPIQSVHDSEERGEVREQEDREASRLLHGVEDTTRGGHGHDVGRQECAGKRG